MRIPHEDVDIIVTCDAKVSQKHCVSENGKTYTLFVFIAKNVEYKTLETIMTVQHADDV